MLAEQLAAKLDEDSLFFTQSRQRLAKTDNVDNRGVVKSVMPLESFIELALSSSLQGSAFGDRFVATDRQMLTLRLAVGRWVAYAPAAK